MNSVTNEAKSIQVIQSKHKNNSLIKLTKKIVLRLNSDGDGRENMAK